MYRLLGLTFLAGLIFAAACLTAEPRIAAGQTGAGNGYVISILRPGDPGFDASLDANFPSLRNLSSFDAMEPLLVIVHNESSHDVKAYVVKWAITNPDGSTVNKFSSVVQAPTGAGVLYGDRVMLAAGEIQLVSPSFHWSTSEFSRFLSTDAPSIILTANERDPLVAQVAQGTSSSLQASVDEVVFDDGTFVGKDSSRSFEIFESERRGQKDEAAWVLKLLRGGSDQQIEDGLHAQILRGFQSNGTDIPSLYYAARGREAERLLDILNGRLGRSGLQNAAARLITSKRIVFRRLSDN